MIFLENNNLFHIRVKKSAHNYELRKKNTHLGNSTRDKGNITSRSRSAGSILWSLKLEKAYEFLEVKN